MGLIEVTRCESKLGLLQLGVVRAVCVISLHFIDQVLAYQKKKKGKKRIVIKKKNVTTGCCKWGILSRLIAIMAILQASVLSGFLQHPKQLRCTEFYRPIFFSC